MRLLVILAALVITGSTQDLQCTSQGGTCLDYTHYICTAGYETGLCSGDSNRRCCMECNSACISSENNYQSCCDSECTDAGGTCMDNSNYCPSGYSSGMCGGSAERQCCGAGSTGGGGIGGGGQGSNECYGDVMNIETDGASQQTASQDNLVQGESASHTMAETDSNRMESYRSKIGNAADLHCVQESVIAAIISRESRAGNALDSDGYGDNGNGYGLMQKADSPCNNSLSSMAALIHIDVRYHTTVGGPYSQEHINQGTGILVDMINAVDDDHPTWTTDQVLKGGICAYNSGPGNVQTYENMDVGTTGGDYSDDVVARAQWYYDSDGYTD